MTVASEIKVGQVIEFDRGLIAGKVTSIEVGGEDNGFGVPAIVKIWVDDLFDPDADYPFAGIFGANSEVRVLRPYGVYSVNEATQEMKQDTALTVYRVGNEWWA